MHLWTSGGVAPWFAPRCQDGTRCSWGTPSSLAISWKDLAAKDLATHAVSRALLHLGNTGFSPRLRATCRVARLLSREFETPSPHQPRGGGAPWAAEASRHPI